MGPAASERATPVCLPQLAVGYSVDNTDPPAATEAEGPSHSHAAVCAGLVCHLR